MITSVAEFDEIRPYEPEEMKQAFDDLLNDRQFQLILKGFVPWLPKGLRNGLLKLAFKGVHTPLDFQKRFMKPIVKYIIHKHTDGCTFDDSALQAHVESRYTFVSNHRDIMLDASLLQYYFVVNGFETTEITFGANLMMHPVVIDVGKSNKMFKVARPSSDIKEFYRNSMHLSEYIRYTIKEKGQSVWIAQRNGRTKNGIDQTDQGIIKMFCMSETKDKIKALDELNIVPIAISYEWESCDILKALELYESQYTKYTKKPGEDLNSILTGILQPKGRVHIAICPPIRMAELSAFERQTNNEYHKSVARLIDSRINIAYRLYPNNYIAHDMLYGNTRYQSMYTEQEYHAFCRHLNKLDHYEDTCDMERLKEIFLGIYANPVDNR